MHGILMRQEKASRLYVTDIKQKLFLIDSVGFKNTTKLLEVYHKYDKFAFADSIGILKKRSFTNYGSMKPFWKINPRCALCLKRGELQESHIYPRHIYKAVGLNKKNKETKYTITTGIEGNVSVIEDENFDGVKEKLLCKGCEELLNHNYERYFAEVFISFDKPLPFHKVSSTLQLVRDGTQFIELTNLDYTKVKLYVLSLLWRASVSETYGSGINISKRIKRRMRKMILNKDAGKESDFRVHFSKPSKIEKTDNRFQMPFIVFPILNDPSIFYTIAGSLLIAIKVENKIKLPAGIDNTWNFSTINKEGRLLIELLDRKRWFSVTFGMTGLGHQMEKNQDVFLKNSKKKKPEKV